MKIEVVPIQSLVESSDNPRIIKDQKFRSLVSSIAKFPKMLEIRPIVVNKDMVIIGGNMRFKACQELKLKTIPIIKAENLTPEQEKEFIIKDNVSAGEWDWDLLANNWEAPILNDWGLGVWNNKTPSLDFAPSLAPPQSHSQITDADVEKGSREVGGSLKNGTERQFIETMCPECGHEFNVEKE